MTRQIAIEDVRDAFTLWEKEYRANPDTFMDDAEQRAKTPGDLGELRALYLFDLLNKLNKGKGDPQ